MSEFSLDSSMSKKSNDFSSIVLSDFYLLCSFVFSNPLYFSYFVFFSPYLFKLFSFLSPLFVTTSLLLLALLTVSPGLLHDSKNVSDISETDDDEFQHFGFEELQVYKIVFEGSQQFGFEELEVRKIVFEGPQQFGFEELEVRKIVFEGSPFEAREEDPDAVLEVKAQEACDQAFQEEPVDKCVIESEISFGNSETNNSDEALWPEIDQKEKEDGGVEDLSWKREEEIEEKEVMPMSVESNKVVVEQPSLRRSGSKAIRIKTRESKVSFDQDDDQDQYSTPRALERYPSFDPSLGSFGSMRKKDKEWKRTLACKLFEERHNAGGDGGAEGMDMLWETYEAESTKAQPKTPKKATKGIAESDEDDEEDDVGVQLCCLQALKFSSGKMNLGMGRPSLVKFSKALKGMGWLHHSSKSSKRSRSLH